MYFAIGVEPTNEIEATSGCSSSASTDSLSPCTTLKTPSGRPASLKRAAPSRWRRDGSFSLGFSTTVLPAAMRDREEPQRHHRREVERADDADDAERPDAASRRRRRSRRSRCTRPSPGAGCRTRTRRPRARARPRRARREVTLPCSLVRIAASSPLRALRISRNANSTCWRLAQRRARPRGERRLRGLHRGVDIRGRCASRTSRCNDTLGGVVDRARARGCAAERRAADPVLEDRQ